MTSIQNASGTSSACARTAAAPEQQVLGGLLGDGRAAARFAQVIGVIDGVEDLLQVDAARGAEAGVLGRDHGRRHHRIIAASANTRH